MRHVLPLWLASLILSGLSLWYDTHFGPGLKLFPRSGALIVCVSVLVPLIRFQYAVTARDKVDQTTDTLLRLHGISTTDDVKRRKHLTLHQLSTVALAVIGTAIAGFGDLIYAPLGIEALPAAPAASTPNAT